MTNLKTAIATAAIAAATSGAVQAETYHIDVTHSQVTFKVKHLGISTVTGTFGVFEGSLDLDPESMTLSRAAATIDAACIDTGVEKRDEHLRSADFFDVAKFPQIVFVSRGIEQEGDGLTIAGDLTLHGVTKRIELAAEITGAATDPWGNERVAISASTAINRKDFGLGWNQVLETGGLLVGEEVQIELEVQGVKQAPKS
jgi:polyisoprenoid-binding protein YceI